MSKDGSGQKNRAGKHTLELLFILNGVSDAIRDDRLCFFLNKTLNDLFPCFSFFIGRFHLTDDFFYLPFFLCPFDLILRWHDDPKVVDLQSLGD